MRNKKKSIKYGKCQSHDSHKQRWYQACSKNTFETLEEKLKDKLTQLSVPEEVSTNIPAVAAGSDNERYIPYFSKTIAGESTQRRQNFLLELWVTCFERMSRNNFIDKTEFQSRLEVSKDCLPPEKKELLEEEQCKNEEDKRAHEESQKALNEARLSVQPHQPVAAQSQQPSQSQVSISKFPALQHYAHTHTYPVTELGGSYPSRSSEPG